MNDKLFFEPLMFEVTVFIFGHLSQDVEKLGQGNNFTFVYIIFCYPLGGSGARPQAVLGWGKYHKNITTNYSIKIIIFC